MEPADIDWKKVDSRFVRDDLYEHFNGPKWVDLLAAGAGGGGDNGDDVAWFCRPDCRHPKTAEDFWQISSATPPTPKVRGLGSVYANRSGGNPNQQRDGNLKRRGVLLPPHTSSSSSSSSSNPQLSSPIRTSPRTTKLPATRRKFREDAENQNPNLNSPAVKKPAAKEFVKSSAEKPREAEEALEDPTPQHQSRRLKSTLSAKNLFAGKDILSQISEFCSELKRLALTGRDRKVECGESDEAEEKKKLIVTPPEKELKSPNSVHQCRRQQLQLQEVKASPPTPQQIPSPAGNNSNQTKPSPLKPFRQAAPVRFEPLQSPVQPFVDNGCTFTAPVGCWYRN